MSFLWLVAISIQSILCLWVAVVSLFDVYYFYCGISVQIKRIEGKFDNSWLRFHQIILYQAVKGAAEPLT